MTLVLEGQARMGADEADVDGVAAVHAPGEADDTIAIIAEIHREVVVVTADRELAEGLHPQAMTPVHHPAFGGTSTRALRCEW